MLTLPDLTAWELPEPSEVRGVDGGTNNAVLIVDDSYVVRTYHNLAADQIEAEHRFLSRLAERAALPFRVPAPIPTRDGRTSVGSTAVFPYIRGYIARREDLGSIELAAEAHGVLLRAMAELSDELAPLAHGDMRRPLDRIRPEVPDIDRLCVELGELFPGDPGLAWFAANVGPAQDAFAKLLTEWPAQLVHGDLSLSNVLIHDGRVSGVLDFEITGVGLYAGDVAAASGMASGYGTPGCAERLAAFQRGFARSGGLLPDEVDALPLLLRHRALGSVVWRVARWRMGHSDLDEIREHLHDGLVQERWLADPVNQSRLAAFRTVPHRD